MLAIDGAKNYSKIMEKNPCEAGERTHERANEPYAVFTLSTRTSPSFPGNVSRTLPKGQVPLGIRSLSTHTTSPTFKGVWFLSVHSLLLINGCDFLRDILWEFHICFLEFTRSLRTKSNNDRKRLRYSVLC